MIWRRGERKHTASDENHFPRFVRYVSFDIEGLSAEYSHSREGHYELRLCTLAFISNAATEWILRER
jgi:hypothetical protein